MKSTMRFTGFVPRFRVVVILMKPLSTIVAMAILNKLIMT